MISSNIGQQYVQMVLLHCPLLALCLLHALHDLKELSDGILSYFGNIQIKYL